MKQRREMIPRMGSSQLLLCAILGLSLFAMSEAQNVTTVPAVYSNTVSSLNRGSQTCLAVTSRISLFDGQVDCLNLSEKHTVCGFPKV